jgi:hypothetical protein
MAENVIMGQAVGVCTCIYERNPYGPGIRRVLLDPDCPSGWLHEAVAAERAAIAAAIDQLNPQI